MEPPDSRDSRSSEDVFSTPPEQVHPHRSRIYFPESSSTGRRVPYSPEGPTMHTHMAPPIRRSSPLNPQRAPGQDRRRPRSSDALNPTTSDPVFRTRRSPLLAPMDDSLPQTVRSIPELDVGTNEAGAFSDEYDLYPRILQDVQRALRIKAKREAKMKAAQPSSDHHYALQSTSVSPSFNPPRSPRRQTYPHLVPLAPSSPLSPIRKTSTSTSSEVDFSPSTRRPQIQHCLHPVPSSLDNGLTLDWGCSTFDEDKTDKKWTISVRRKDKDKLPPLELMQDQQEKNHRERLSQIRASASSQTLRKAAMTSDQLQRRYGLMQESPDAKSTPLNIAMISRWYGSQNDLRRQELERVEPLTWLKHLPRRRQQLSRWHLSARIMEEFTTAQTMPQPPRMESIPEDYLLQSLSRPPTHDQSPERKRTSFDENIRSPWSSYDVESTKSGESTFSSIPSSRVISPIPSVTQHRRQRARTPSHPEYAGSGAEDSTKLATNRTSPDKLLTKKPPLPSGRGDLRNEAIIDLGDNLPKIVLPASDVDEINNDKASERKPGAKSRSNLDLPGVNRKFASSPLLRYPPPPDPEDIWKGVQNEETLRREYEQKTTHVLLLQLLEEAMAQNQRIRQLLNRISISVKEYDTAQRTAMNALGKKYQSLPKELVESFGHDPAAVTGATRRLKGWRAAEDIHQRLIRQREVFSTFINLESRQTSDNGSILDDKISSLMGSLNILEQRKEELAGTAKEVESVLRDVQEEYKSTKEDYNKTVSLTSALYPELSRAVALEESYKDQYQQIWEFGMDALTLLLDTVTPFWRTYGKTIGEDVRDFLIIPLYRNEFTGEAKRYSINTFPRRSSRHWLGLVIFFLASILLVAFQGRIAISSTVHSRLKWIPFEGMRYTALPFFWIMILMQWCAVFVECGIVFMELGVIAWWLAWFVNLLT
ncbi:hypothetical protein P691DRAFT_656679 [Macrolepiota fuliginosa MF-IS2]|uniref:Uncharacterized protein n=1 Tax=Macrolepiota fuliginosa MF-IS2 TaxID=1400762 RepID=A0A9P5XME3_9AGAR|nr:hypothetical protein P691DRAFT_656679 [Macrolepiota fuliginosa MF-IS2]